MRILFENAVRELPPLCFATPERVIEARTQAEVAAALHDMQAALSTGRFVAGFFSYELGYLLEPRLAPLLPAERPMPLLAFGVFEAPQQIDAAELNCAGHVYAGPLRHEWSRADYSARVARIQAYIAAGDIYQANLSFRSKFPFAGDPLALYAELRERAGASYCAFVDCGQTQILSLSPELFFEVAPEGIISVRPMKGTAARGSDVESDDAGKRALAASAKERAENLMIVDLLRNDLGRIARIGSVAVKELFKVETYPTLHTMVSTIAARLTPDVSVEGLVRALFPCGSVTGAPKIRAMEIIRELEGSPRGAYCGAIGYFSPDGSARFNVAIRTITISGGKGTLGIGGAVVHDSTAEAEHDECLLKARFFEAGRRRIGLIETLRWDGGFVRLSPHLARLEQSAACLAIPFDREAVTGALDESVTGGVAPLRVKLVLDEDGRVTCEASQLSDLKPSWTFMISPHHVKSDNALARHKTTWREFYDRELAGVGGNADEVVFLNERGDVAEGSRSTVFVRDGEMLYTPPLSAGILDGVLRRELIKAGKCRETNLTLEDLETAEEIFLGSSLRGLIPAQSVRSGAG